MSEIKTLNGYSIADTAAREKLTTLTEEIEEHQIHCGITVNTSELREQYNDFNTLPKNALVSYYVSAFNVCKNTPEGFTTGSVLTVSTINRSSNFANQIAMSQGRMWTRMLFGDTWTEWENCTNRDAGKPKYIYVAVNGSDETGDGSQHNPYATIYHANEMITDAAEDNRYVIKVADGVYTDLQSRYANTNATSAQGVVCKDYVEYVGNVENPSACVIQWDGVYGYDAIPAYSGVAEKCPFHIGRNWTLAGLHTAVRGFKIVGKNLRYCMHIDTGGKGKNVEWEVSDCIFEWGGCPDVSDASNVTDIACIGTGSSNFERGTLKRCTLVASDGITKGFENHDTIYYSGYEDSPAFYEGAKITIDSCNFNGLDIIVRSYYSDAEVLTQGYDILHVMNTVGVNRLIPSPRNGVTNKWWAKIECSNIQTNGFN